MEVTHIKSHMAGSPGGLQRQATIGRPGRHRAIPSRVVGKSASGQRIAAAIVCTWTAGTADREQTQSSAVARARTARRQGLAVALRHLRLGRS